MQTNRAIMRVSQHQLSFLSIIALMLTCL